jgi:deoxycytidylate deaminase
MTHEDFLALARQASLKSGHHTHKMGCVIAKGNKILGTGFNALKTHPKSPHAYKSIHAEFMAATNAGYEIEGATVYIFRQQKNGTWSMAKPCPSCHKFLLECGVLEVVYSFEGSFKQESLG